MSEVANSTWAQATSGEAQARAHGMINVGLERVADVALQPTTILAVTIWLMRGSWMMIAVVVAIAGAAPALSSIVMPYALQRVTDTRLFLLVISLIHAITAILITLLGWQAASFTTRQFVWLLMVWAGLYFLSGAANMLRNPRSTIANIDQTSEPLTRQFVGAIGAFIAAFAVWRTLGDRGLGFPQSIGWLFVLGGIATIASVWYQVTAPIRPRDMQQKPLVATRQDVVQTLMTPLLRRLLLVRLLLGMATVADSFILIYGLQRLGLQLPMVGMVVVAIVLAQLICGVTWTLFTEYRGRAWSIQFAALLRVTGLTLAAATPYFATTDWFASLPASSTFASVLFMVVFFMLAMSNTTLLRNEQVAGIRRLDDYHLYPASNLLIQVVTFVTALTPLLGAALLNWIRFETLMGMAALLALLGLIATGWLSPRKRLPRRLLRPTPRGGRSVVKRSTPKRRAW